MHASALAYRSDVQGSSWCARILAMALQSNLGCSVKIGYRENTKYLKPRTEHASAKKRTRTIMRTETQVYLQVKWSLKASELIMNCSGWWFFHNLLCKLSCSVTLDLLDVSGQIKADFTRHSAGIQTVNKDNHHNNTNIKKNKMKHNFRNTLNDCIPPKYWRAFSIYCTYNCYFSVIYLVLSSCGRNIH